MILILAPHVDDEVIGCFQIFRHAPLGGEKIMVCYCDRPGDERLDEAEDASDYFHFQIFTPDDVSDGGEHLQEVIEGAIIRATAQEEISIIWAPDPHWDLHPFHKMVGSTAHYECRRRQYRFGTYTTNMNTPYLRELPDVVRGEKKKALDEFFPSQRSLWEHDHRYWMFEGQAIWDWK